MSTRPVQIDDLFKLKFIHDAQFSPDGSKIVYSVSHIDGEKNAEKEHMALWLMTVETGETHQLTSGQTVDSSPRWSPDGKEVAFMSARGEKPQIYIIPVDGGEARALTKLKQGVGSGPEWSPDGKQIAFTAGVDREPRDPKKPYRVDRHPYRFDNMGYLDDVVQDIYVISIDSGEIKQLTKDRTMNSQPKWSPDGQKILYTASFPVDTIRWLPGLRVVNLEGSVEDVVWDWGVVSAGAWLPDSHHIAFIGTTMDALPGTKADLWMTCVERSTPECRTAGLKVGVGGGLQDDMPVVAFYSTALFITEDGKMAYTQVQDSGNIHIYRVALAGDENWEPVLTGERAIHLHGFNRAERHLLYSISTLQNPTDMYIADIEGGNEKRLTSINADFLGQLTQPEVENLHFTSVGGVEVEGWIMKPTQGEAPYPTILYIHGGPHGAFGNIYSFDFQMLAGAGYAVLFTNYRGSTGYGTEFGTAISEGWGDLDFEDHMAAIDYVIAKGIADPDRLGVCGLSAGGFGTCNIIGKTQRFKAAVPENPVTNFVTLYGVSDIGTYINDMMRGKPYEKPELYARLSPISRAHLCTTPTLLIQGEHDWRCPAEQSEQFFTVLKDNGCIVEMLRLPESSHGGSIAGALPIRQAHNEALLDWMNRYLMNGK
jgi:dipeptidyl aminopeptidase/acylaminoacyl peptidase